jgi:hypothetical protein
MKDLKQCLVLEVSVCLIFTCALYLCALVEAKDVGDLAEFRPYETVEMAAVDAGLEEMGKVETLVFEETVETETLVETSVETSVETEVLMEEEKPRFFDIPLDEDLQTYIFELSEDIGIDPAIVIAIIEKESNYDISAVGDHGRSLGLMQIQFRWHTARMAELGCDDLLDARQNICVGIDILADLLEEGKSIEWVLMAYNGGHTYADRLASEGRVSEYANKIIEIANELERK